MYIAQKQKFYPYRQKGQVPKKSCMCTDFQSHEHPMTGKIDNGDTYYS